MEKHNHLSMVHQFNTAHGALEKEVAQFIRRGK
jgi:hypothetical protein